MIDRSPKARYRLRAPEPEDLEVMYRFENTPSLWEVSNATGPYSRFFLKRYIERNRNDLYTDRQLRLMVADEENRVAGIIDLFNFDPFHNRAEVGIVIAEECRNQGVGAWALNRLAEHCFELLGIHQLYAYIDMDNRASLRLFSACGFRECARLKDWMKRGDKYKDVLLVQRIID